MATQELLDLSLERATSLNSRYGGMASIKLEWHPYECEWVTAASWSSGKTFQTHNKSVENSIVELCYLLWADRGLK